MATPKQITIRNPSPEVVDALRARARRDGQSLNATILEVLGEALGVEARRARLAEFADWSAEDAAEFDEALRAQRVVDEALWR